jgi:hypothetical protein
MFKVLAGANFPFVCANLTKGQLASDPKQDELFFKPYIIVEKMIKDGAGNESPVKIGFVGFVPPQIMLWDIKNLEGKAQTRDIVEAARAWVPVMKEEGADIVIASPTPASTAQRRPRKWKTRRCTWLRSTVSTRSSPDTSISSSPGRKRGTTSPTLTPSRARCTASPLSWQVSGAHISA